MAFLEQFSGPPWLFFYGDGQRLCSTKAEAQAFLAERAGRGAHVSMDTLDGKSRYVGGLIDKSRVREFANGIIGPAIVIEGKAKAAAVWRWAEPIDKTAATRAFSAFADHYGIEQFSPAGWLPIPEVSGYADPLFQDDRVTLADLAIPTATRPAILPPPPPFATAAESSPRLFVAAHEVKAESIDWLWRDVCAVGEFTLIGGEPGIGKSQISINLGANTTTGCGWPDGERREPGSVIICESEDDIPTVIRPRIEAAGADISRVRFASRVMDFSEGPDLQSLKSMAETMAPRCRLIILSPVVSFFGKLDTDENRVRQRIGPLLAWAKAERIAIIGVTHTPKDGKSNDRFTGSDAFRRAARSAWSAVVDKTDPQPNIKLKRRMLIAAKANNGGDTAAFRYRIEPVTLPNGVETSRVVWDGAKELMPANALADDVSEETSFSETHNQNVTTQPTAKPDAKTRAMAWVLETLKDGQKTAVQMRNAARLKQISYDTLGLARQELEVLGEIEIDLSARPAIWRIPSSSPSSSAQE